MKTPFELLWAIIGLLLTIGGTFVEAFVANPTGLWEPQPSPMVSLGVTYQVGAGLFVGCLGGKKAGALSQFAYLLLGLTPWFQVFYDGGGLEYFQRPTFGYLLGFVPGAWICGGLAFKASPKLELLAFSCLSGLFAVHSVGILYLTLNYLWRGQIFTLPTAVMTYSIAPLPGQLAVVCAVTVMAYFFRRLMLY